MKSIFFILLICPFFLMAQDSTSMKKKLLLGFEIGPNISSLKGSTKANIGFSYGYPFRIIFNRFLNFKTGLYFDGMVHNLNKDTTYKVLYLTTPFTFGVTMKGYENVLLHFNVGFYTSFNLNSNEIRGMNVGVVFALGFNLFITKHLLFNLDFSDYYDPTFIVNGQGMSSNSIKCSIGLLFKINKD